MEKMTITERINGINFETLTQDDFDFLVERALKSVRKSSGVRKPTKAQIANEGLKADLLNAITKDPVVTDTGEVLGMSATAAGDAVGITVQRASALLKQMVDAGQVVRVKNGRATFFKAVD